MDHDMLTNPVRPKKGRKAGVTIGNFDGVHLGHRKLIGRTLEVCRQRDLDCYVVTFWPHPRVFFSGNAMQPLAEMEVRRATILGMGVSKVLELPFDASLASLSTMEFLERYILPLNLASLVIGYDFRLGKGRSGDFETLSHIGQEQGFSVEQVPPLMLGDAPISSTRLRKAVGDGRMRLARDLLGHHYFISGPVVHGDGRGTGMGFPTANLAVPSVLLPPDGVYATMVRHGESVYPAVTNIGFKPTFGGRERTIESFLLDCDVNLYEERIDLSFLARIRDEMLFPSVEALTARIAEDVNTARGLFAQVRPLGR